MLFLIHLPHPVYSNSAFPFGTFGAFLRNSVSATTHKIFPLRFFPLILSHFHHDELSRSIRRLPRLRRLDGSSSDYRGPRRGGNQYPVCHRRLQRRVALFL